MAWDCIIIWTGRQSEGSGPEALPPLTNKGEQADLLITVLNNRITHPG